jgi:hypothetical protein
MKQQIQLLDKTMLLKMSPSAERLLSYRHQPLLVEMELYFSCLIRKKVRFREYIDCDIKTTVNDQLTIGFRPVMTEICSVDDCHNAPPPVTDFPIVKAERYIPHWLTLDYDGEDWVGEFGYN